ncbi:unnamed protein product [Choristocarpus tenellus]
MLVLGCPLKPDAAYVVGEVRDSGHSVAMITGDGALTAADVARKVGMIDQPPERTLVLAVANGGNGRNSGFYWEPLVAGSVADEVEGRGVVGAGAVGKPTDFSCLQEDGTTPLDLRVMGELSLGYSLCVSGDVLSQLIGAEFTEGDGKGKGVGKGSGVGSGSSVFMPAPASALSLLCPHVSIFARVSPDQKERIVRELNASGRHTLFCGDGTNDVGALRRSHVGVSIVNSPEMEKRLQAYVARDGTGDDSSNGRGGESNESEDCGVTGDGRGGDLSSEASRSRVLALAEAQEQDMDPQLVRLGDASIASPFTAKTTSVGCVLTVIRQGRCTLVTTLQVYKILALNCLTSAYILSALYLHGMKQGDYQMTVLGLVMSAFFFLTSRARPLERLSKARPPTRIFCLPVIFSVVGQFATHLTALLVVTGLCLEHVDPNDESLTLDGDFEPNTFNSSVFLLSAVMQVNTFVANYTGRPFMEPLQDNKPMWWLVIASYTILACVSLGIFPWLDTWLQLSPFPPGFRMMFLGVLVAETALTYTVEAVARQLW